MSLTQLSHEVAALHSIALSQIELISLDRLLLLFLTSLTILLHDCAICFEI